MSADNQSLVRHGSFDDSVFDQQAQQVDDLAGSDFMKLDVGDNVVRFLPPPVGMSTPFRVSSIHYIEPIPGLIDKKLVFACPRLELKQSCIACAKSNELARSGNPLDREMAAKMSAKLAVYANVINRRSPEPVVRVLKFGKTIFEALKAIRKNPRLGGDFTDPSETGFDIVITRKGTGRNDTEYSVMSDRGNSPIHHDPAFAQMLIDGQHNLDLLVQPVIPEALLLAWSGGGRQAFQPAAHPGLALPGGRMWNPPGAVMPGAQQPAITTSGTAVQSAQDVFEDDGFGLDK